MLIGEQLTMHTTAKFFVGQIIHHIKFDYRGVIFDVDATFRGTDEWYAQIARSQPPRDLPWYHVLVDGTDQTTYVAERHLEPDNTKRPIAHPLVLKLCGKFETDRYMTNMQVQ